MLRASFLRALWLGAPCLGAHVGTARLAESSRSGLRVEEFYAPRGTWWATARNPFTYGYKTPPMDPKNVTRVREGEELSVATIRWESPAASTGARRAGTHRTPARGFSAITLFGDDGGSPGGVYASEPRHRRPDGDTTPLCYSSVRWTTKPKRGSFDPPTATPLNLPILPNES